MIPIGQHQDNAYGIQIIRKRKQSGELMLVVNRKNGHINVPRKTTNPDGKILEFCKNLQGPFGDHQLQDRLKVFAFPFVITI
jgi:hypothetical protein